MECVCVEGGACFWASLQSLWTRLMDMYLGSSKLDNIFSHVIGVK